MKKGHSIDTIMTLILFCVFTASVLAVLMMGIQSYQGVVTSMKESYEERTFLQYVATKVKHYSGEGSVEVTEFGDGTAIALNETIENCDYVTYIYVYNGVAMELFCDKDVALPPDAGCYIMETEAFDVLQVRDDLLRITCSGDGGTASVYVGIYGKEASK